MRTVTVSLVEALLLRATVGLTDRLQVSGGIGLTAFVGVPAWELGAKLRLISSGRFHLAVVVEHFGIRFDRYSGLALTGGGAVASVCIDAACGSVLSFAGAGGWFYYDDDESPAETTIAALFSPSAVLALPGGFLKLVVESHLPSTAVRDGLWAALLRLPLGPVTVDLGAFGVYSDLADIEPAGTLGYRW